MKKVLDPQTVAHYWANKVQSEATNSNRSFYFDGDAIYSYGRHFPIAKHINEKVLFTTRSYSNTTAKHISIVRAACSHLPKVYAPYIDGSHSDNFSTWQREIESNLKAMRTARKPEKYFTAIQHLQNEAKTYCEFMAVKPTKELKKLLLLTFENAEQLVSKQAEAAKKEAKIIQEKGSKLFYKYIKLWRAGLPYEQISEQIKPSERLILNKYINLSDITILRVIDGQVETSKGVKLPIDVAKRYAEAYKNGTLRQGDSVLNYSVSEVSPKYIKIGCHNIPAEQVEYIRAI